MKISREFLGRIHRLKEGEQIQVILFLNEPFDSLRVNADIDSKKGGMLTPIEDTSNWKVAIGSKETLLSLIDFPWLRIMIENQKVVLIE